MLSLDAPLVALVWQDFLVRCYPVLLRAPGRIALGLTVWAIYVADRLLDVRTQPHAAESLRHRFFRRWRAAWLCMLIIIVSADSIVVFRYLRPALLDEGLLLLPGVAMYLAVFAAPGRSRIPAKKIAAGVFFTAGVFLVEFAGGLWIWRQVTVFFALCTANLILVELWERNRPTAKLRLFTLPLAILCLFPAGAFFRAVAIAAAALAILSSLEERLPTDARCVLADVALLSPLLFR
jgi:hypothetical protein